MTGFSKQTQANFVLTVGQESTLNFTLQVGTVGSTFVVGARDLSNTNTTFFTPGTVNGLDLDSAGQPPFSGASDVTFPITINALPKPATASLLSSMDPATVTLDDALRVKRALAARIF